MFLLQAAESRLGRLTSWPSEILNYLFFDPPTFRTVLRLVNFFYGNHIPCSLAIQLFHACNDGSDAFMTEDVHLFYEAYEKNTHAVHMGIYFDVRHEKFLRLNGTNKNQLEIVESINPNISRGFTGRTDDEIAVLRNKISNVPYY